MHMKRGEHAVADLARKRFGTSTLPITVSVLLLHTTSRSSLRVSTPRKQLFNQTPIFLLRMLVR